MHKTKIICTLGPASASYDVLKKMALAGMDVVRLNFSHGSYEDHKKKINIIKKLRDELDLPLPILLDTKGPEVRIGDFEEGKVDLLEGDIFSFTSESLVGNQSICTINYKNLEKEIKKGDGILINNGLMRFSVTEVLGNKIITVVETAGTLTNKKSVSLPSLKLNLPYLSEKDKEDLLFGIEHDVDFVAASFVRRREDVAMLSTFLKENGGGDIDIIAKIENSEGVENIEEICSECSGIMVARGDLGVEVPFEKLPAIQKELIHVSRFLGRRVITATEMLESMITSPRPTRAEISDVANAVYDGTSAIMLSGETAVGIDPVRVIQTMSKIACEAERNINYEKRFSDHNFKINSTTDAISHATVNTAIDLGAKLIVVCTSTGTTARMVSRFRPPMPILGMTTTRKVFRKLALSWGVIPTMSKLFKTTDDLFQQGRLAAKTTELLAQNDSYVITAGVPIGQAAVTNMIKVDIMD